ncbi:MAG: electron transfer flavoprotein subunit beta/FixA family protein [Desulforhabdus sp.]|jgi:electron transfer flavoprotein beta subunit|nr:electron transfer flavoprotein subunit beta/FixA family protein [Desulforhabdus sp.]
MKIVVCVKQVPLSNNVKIDPQTHNMIRDDEEGRMNPFDRNAVEEALCLKETRGAEVIAMSMGPPNFISTLREALSMGCDSAVLLSSRAFGGADTLATGYTLSQAIKKIGNVDLILFGRQAVDADTGQVGPIVAEFLNIPQVTFVSKINMIDEAEIEVTRFYDDEEEVVRTRFPLAATVRSELNTPRYATPLHIRHAFRKKITVYNETDLKCDPSRIGMRGSPTVVTSTFKPKKSGRNMQRLKGNAEKAALELISILRDRKLL